MLDKIYLKFGSSLGKDPLEFEPGAITIFVGPNNSGKSLLLREIEKFTEYGDLKACKIIENIGLRLPPEEEIIQLWKQIEIPGSSLQEKTIKVYRVFPYQGGSREVSIHVESFLNAIQNDKNPSVVCPWLVSLFTVKLDGRTRLTLTDQFAGGDLLRYPEHHIMALFKDNQAREKLRNITADAFGFYFVIDPTSMRNFRVRMSKKPPQDSSEEQGLDQRAINFHQQAVEITELSDGVKAFTGILAAVMSTDYRIMLIDEPEAFLHPPLARKLGRKLTELASEREAHVLAATHSPDFLMGCIQAGKKANIIRLAYQNNVATARFLSADKLEEMMRDPLLRSSGVLSALFHQGAIVGEADRDRAFYQEINERLLAAGQGGIDNCIFLNAQNWQTIQKIIRPLREMGIPAAAIYDLDIIKGDGSDFGNVLKSAFVPQGLIDAWGVLRGNIKRKFEEETVDLKKQGINSLSQASKETAQNFLNNLNEYGIFLVPNGEVECWLPELGVTVGKKDWLIEIFKLMGTDPSAPDYVTPRQGDVWDFIKKVAAWIDNPSRKGMSE